MYNARKMTDRSNVEHLSVVTTAETVDDVTQTTSVNVVTSSLSHGFEFYFQCAVIVIGVVGTAANALILYAMVASKQHKKHILIFHQNVLDLVSCLFLVITYAVKLCNFYLTGLTGYWLCMLILSENLLWSVILGSKANLVFITIERYLKVVHPVWSKKKLRNWMIYSAMAFAWISGFIQLNALAFITSDVVDGVCYAFVMWENRVAEMCYGIFGLLFYSVFILIIFVFCYWRILIAIRRQAQVMARYYMIYGIHCNGQVKSHQMQSNVIQTMILVSAFYAISDLPLSVYIRVMNIGGNFTILEGSYYSTLFVSFFYFCANPFIYAAKFDPVKRILLRLIPCKKTVVQPIESIELAVASAITSRSQP